MAMARTAEFVIGSAAGAKVRAAFTDSLFEPRAIPPSTVKKYGCTLIIKKSDAEIVNALRNAVIECVQAQWGDKGVERLKKGVIKNPILDGSTSVSKKTGDLHAGFDDSVIFIRPQSGEDNPPSVLYRSPNVQASKAEVYSGCYGKAVLNCFAWSHPQNGDGVSFGLAMFQKLSDGDRLGGGPIDTSKYFEKVEDAGPVEGAAKTAGASAFFE